MSLDATARRRWFGALVLLAALAMLVAGLTVLRGRLNAYAFLLYWLACMVFTFIAMCVALADARDLRHRTRAEERDLLETTLRNIEADAKGRKGPNPRNN